MSENGPNGATTVVMPVKSFADAKGRLAPVLDASTRASLARDMADRTLRAAHGLPVVVVCADPDVMSWARQAGATVVPDPSDGLDAAVAAGLAHAEAAGATKIIVAHADLPLATDLRPVADFDGITLVPDRREDGTNVICLPAGARFAFAYGPASFSRHLAAAHASGCAVRVLREPSLAWDVDQPEDLAAVAQRGTAVASPVTAG